MKNIFYLFLLILAVWLPASCDDANFLDETQTTDLDYETVFSDSVYTVAFLQEIYRQAAFDVYPSRFIVKDGLIETSYGGIQGACDEAEAKQISEITTDVQFATGTVNPVTVDAYTWKYAYENIRRVNVFLANVDKAPISAARRTIYKSEARFLRAHYYFILLKHYGGIPLIGDVVYSGPDDDIKTTRDTFEDCVKYIVQECNEAGRELQIKPKGRDYGRVGRGACMALKARTLLYAASPLFNEKNYAPGDYPKELVGYTAYDKERWKLAMEAAEEIISLDLYHPFVKQVNKDGNPERGFGYYATFLSGDFYKEGAQDAIIFELQTIKNVNLHQLYSPPSCGGNMKAGYPYQDLVNAYPMKNGKAIHEENSGYDDQNPYANRDPRLANTIVYDGSRLKSGSTDDHYIYTYLGTGATQDALYDGTPTGYYFRKACHREAAANYFIMPPQPIQIFRYAEVLLNYAEARNEYSGPSDEVYKALTAIREVAGIEPGDDELYGLKKDMNQDEMRVAIQNERRVEFAIEGHRFFDVRRWKIADKTDNKMMNGMEIRLNGDKKTYKEFGVRPHVFREAMYLFPIPDKEVSKSPDLIQNPYY